MYFRRMPISIEVLKLQYKVHGQSKSREENVRTAEIWATLKSTQREENAPESKPSVSQGTAE